MRNLSQRIINWFGSTDKVLHFSIAALITSVSLNVLLLLFTATTFIQSLLFIGISTVISIIFMILKECLDSGWNIKSERFDKRDILFGLYGTVIVDVIAIICLMF